MYTMASSHLMSFWLIYLSLRGQLRTTDRCPAAIEPYRGGPDEGPKTASPQDFATTAHFSTGSRFVNIPNNRKWMIVLCKP
jgi:hypothetical protein